MKSNFGRFIPLLFFIALAFIIGNAFVLFTSLHDLINEEKLVLHTHDILTQVDVIFLSLRDARFAQREYILTGQDTYLQQFPELTDKVIKNIASLESLTKDNPIQTSKILFLTKRSMEEISLLKQGVSIRQTESVDKAIAFISSGQEVAKLQQVRSIINDISSEEAGLLHERAGRYQISVDEVYSAIIISLLFGIFFIMMTFYSIKREFDQRSLSEERKNDFISIASHELKTPITSMSVFTDLLKKRIELSKDRQSLHYLQKIREQIQKQTGLISDLLDISKMQAGKIELEREPFDMNKLIKTTVETVQATSKTHKLIIKGRSKNKVFGDKQRIGQVLINFLSNAIKYSPNAKKVVVMVKEERKVVFVSIQDFGIGLARKHHKKIFTRFYRASEKDKLFPGFGIGLYITFEIIRRHSGKVWVVSSEGKGSTFTFTIPVATYI